MTKFLLKVLTLVLAVAAPLAANEGDPPPIQALLQEHGEIIAKSSRKTIGPAIDALAASGLTEAQEVLEQWQAKELWIRKEDGVFFYAEKRPDRQLMLIDIASGAEVVQVSSRDMKQLKPNSGIRGMIGAALVRFQLMSPDPATRSASLDAIERDAEESHLMALRGAIDSEPDPGLKARKERLERLLTIRFDEAEDARIAAVRSFEGDLGVDVRATLNPLVSTTRVAVTSEDSTAADIKQRLTPGSDDLPREEAYALLVAQDLAPPRVSRDDIKTALIDNIDGDTVGGIQIATLGEDAARAVAFAALADAGTVPPAPTEADVDAALAQYVFVDRYQAFPLGVILAAEDVLASIEARVDAVVRRLRDEFPYFQGVIYSHEADSPDSSPTCSQESAADAVRAGENPTWT
ncbi:MAG: hypothetical protein AAFX00_09945, partial [Pseudomonadota bacterium]